MTIGYSGPLDRAWQRMRLILFSPFDLGKWIVLGFSAWLANLLSGFGGGGFRGFHGNLDSSELDELTSACRASRSFIADILEHWYWILLAAIALLLLAGFTLLCLWLSSRAKFVFLDNVVHDRARIAEPWRRYRDLGNSLFLWRLGFLLAGLLLFAVLFGAVTGLWTVMHGHLTFVGIVLPLAVLAVVPVVVLLYVNLYLENFVVPIMYGFGLGAVEAWRVFLEWWKRHTAPFLVYGLFILGLSLVVGIAILVIGFATCCVGFFLMILPFIGTVLTLPVWVTYRALGIEFLAQMDPRFDLFAAAIAETAEPEAAGGDGDGEPSPPAAPAV